MSKELIVELSELLQKHHEMEQLRKSLCEKITIEMLNHGLDVSEFVCEHGVIGTEGFFEKRKYISLMYKYKDVEVPLHDGKPGRFLIGRLLEALRDEGISLRPKYYKR